MIQLRSKRNDTVCPKHSLLHFAEWTHHSRKKKKKKTKVSIAKNLQNQRRFPSLNLSTKTHVSTSTQTTSLHFQREGTQVWGHYWTTRRLQSNGRQVSGSAPQIFLSWRLVLLLWDDESRRGSLHLRRSGKSNAMSTVSIARQNKKKSVNAPFCPVLHIQFPSVPLYKQRLGKQDFQLLTALLWHPKKQQPTTPCKTTCVFRPSWWWSVTNTCASAVSSPPLLVFFLALKLDLLGPFMQQVS